MQFWKLASIYIFILIVGGIGWIFNIVKLSQCDFAEPYKAEAIRIAGIFVPPMGAVTGYITINDKSWQNEEDQKNQ